MAGSADLWNLEKSFWLDAEEFCRSHMEGDARIAFLPPVGTLSGPEAVKRMESAPRYSEVDFADISEEGSESEIVLNYRAAGWADAATPHVAQCSSHYVRGRDGWKLREHRRTPVS